MNAVSAVLRRFPQLWIAMVILIAIGVTFYSLVQPGNNLGIDEWAALYRALQGASEYSDRPLTMILLTLIAPIIGTNQLGYHVLSIILWIINAILVYINIRLLAPDRPIFALVCGILYIVYFQDDFYILLTLMYTSDSLTSMFFVLGAFALHFAYMQHDARPRNVRILLLISSVGLAAAAPLVRESTVPILLGLPALVFLMQRQFDRARWIGVAALWAGVFASALRYLLPLIGIGDATYSSGMIVSFNPIRMFEATLIQIDFAINPLIHVGRQRIAAVWPVIALLALWIAAGFFLMRQHLRSESDSPLRQRLWTHGAWILGSAAAMWLGFAAYLPTLYADSTWRTHMLSKPGEAVLLASLIWLGSDLFSNTPKWVLRYLGAVYIAMAGAAMVWHVQASLIKYGGTWDNLGAFMRSMPEVDSTADDPTLFIYMQVPNPYETPFTNGFGLQYALRYFYEDRATGIIPIDEIRGEVTVGDDGITLREDWVEGTTHFGWDEMIFIGRNDATGAVVILDEIPEEFYSADRQAQYDPDEIVIDGMAERIRETFVEP